MSLAIPHEISERSQGQLRERDWSETDLEKVSVPVPFVPRVYLSRFWQRNNKRYHRPDCVEAIGGDAIDLDYVVENGYKPCKSCGGVNAKVNGLEVANKIDELWRVSSRTDTFRHLGNELHGSVEVEFTEFGSAQDWFQLCVELRPK